MKTTHRILAITSAALLLGFSMPAQAIDVNVGGLGVNATTGGGNVATVGVTTDRSGGGGTNLNAVVSNSDGSLVDVQSEDNTTTGNVNLGGTGNLAGIGGDGGGGGVGGTGLDDIEIDLGGLLPGGILPGGGNGGAGGNGGPGGAGGIVTGTQVANSFNSLSGSDQTALRIQCRTVIENPEAFDPSTLALCRLLMRMPN